MLLIGPFAQAEAQYRQSRLVSHEIESHRRRRARRPARSRARRPFRWPATRPTTASPA